MEGEWDDIVRVVHQCHERARGVSAHVLTTITIEDERGAQDKLASNVASLEEKLGRKLKRVGATIWPCALVAATIGLRTIGAHRAAQ